MKQRKQVNHKDIRRVIQRQTRIFTPVLFVILKWSPYELPCRFLKRKGTVLNLFWKTHNCLPKKLCLSILVLEIEVWVAIV